MWLRCTFPHLHFGQSWYLSQPPQPAMVYFFRLVYFFAKIAQIFGLFGPIWASLLRNFALFCVLLKAEKMRRYTKVDKYQVWFWVVMWQKKLTHMRWVRVGSRDTSLFIACTLGVSPWIAWMSHQAVICPLSSHDQLITFKYTCLLSLQNICF